MQKRRMHIRIFVSNAAKFDVEIYHSATLDVLCTGGKQSARAVVVRATSAQFPSGAMWVRCDGGGTMPTWGRAAEDQAGTRWRYQIQGRTQPKIYWSPDTEILSTVDNSDCNGLKATETFYLLLLSNACCWRYYRPVPGSIEPSSLGCVIAEICVPYVIIITFKLRASIKRRYRLIMLENWLNFRLFRGVLKP